MFERAGRGNRAVLLHPVFAGTGPEVLDEFQELCRSAGVEIAVVLTAPRDRPDARFFVGKGKIEEVAEQVSVTGADLVLVSCPLSAIQERNIEKSLSMPGARPHYADTGYFCAYERVPTKANYRSNWHS